MTRRNRSGAGRVTALVTASAAILGAATLLFRRNHVARLRAVVGARYDEESGRGRQATPASPAARTAGHEVRDLRGGTLAKLVLLLGSVAFCMIFAMVGLRVWVTTVQRDNQPALTQAQRTIITPPDPQLQRDPVRELANLRARADSLLDGYALLGSDKTRARIPIDRAMSLMVGQPLAPPP